MKKQSLLVITFVFIFGGCAIVRHAVPVGMLGNAQIIGRKDIRAIEGIPSKNIADDLIVSLGQETEEAYFKDEAGARVYSALAISGGAANGAYGAGLLKGWSERGTRSKFKIVTGISTGAIIAPFAFLGREYDQQLERFYTSYTTKDLIKGKNIFQMFFGNSLVSNAPFKALIDKYFTGELMNGIAEEYRKGRRLYIGTTNLDAQKLVIWDMGKIASIGDDKSLLLFRKVILASVSIPTAFPPVYFDAQINDEIYNEMHVDGGIMKQVFFLYDILRDFDSVLSAKGIDVFARKLKIYVIRNGFVGSVWKEVPDDVGAITERSVDTLVNAQGIGDLYRLYIFSQKEECDFNLAYIPEDYTPDAKEFFDIEEMQRLFDLGYKEAIGGYPWHSTPPGFKSE